jgi:hypothetical protein
MNLTEEGEEDEEFEEKKKSHVVKERALLLKELMRITSPSQPICIALRSVAGQILSHRWSSILDLIRLAPE